MSYWQDKVVIVTGGSSGLGKQIAARFAEAGARVVIAARGSEKLAATAAELSHGGRKVLAVPADVTRQADVDNLIDETMRRFGQLDVLVNNAGRSARGDVLSTTAEDFQELMDLNLTALVRCTRAAATHLLATRGHVVNIGSLAAKSASRYMGAYAATKFAVAAYSQQLRLELGPQGLHVLLVCPGPIASSTPRVYSEAELAKLPESARQPGAGVKVGRLQPEQIAAAILRACEKRRPEIVLPRKARLLFAISQLSPSLGDWLIRKMT